MSSNFKFKSDTIENDFGIFSIDESTHHKKRLSSINGSCITTNSSSSSSGSNSSDNRHYMLPQQCDVAPKIKLTSSHHQKSNHFRMIVCGDSGIGKSALVQALSLQSEQQSSTTLEPIEVFAKESNTCIVDTCGYGALLRAEVIFSNVKAYIENQFQKTNNLFSKHFADNDRLTYMVYQSTDIFTHVNACLYLIMGRLKPVDIEYMRSIHDLVNIIPVIIQPDLALRPELRTEQRLEILATMESNSIKYSLMGYEDYQDLVRACRETSKNPHCPPFMLDWSITKHKKSSFHGLLPLKQALYQHQYKYLHYTTTEKFTAWRHNYNNTAALSTPALSSVLTTSSSQEQVKNMNHSIRISQYVSKRRHSMEREMLIQEKKLREEFELANKQRRTELILKELNALVRQDEKLLINRNHSNEEPVTPHSSTQLRLLFWILLSVFLSLFICYQNRNLLLLLLL